MATWEELPRQPIKWQRQQQEFLAAHRLRRCPSCIHDYNCPEHLVCPNCGARGFRVYDRLTIIAGRRFGKSFIGALAAVEEAMIPNTVGWACAPTVPKLHRYIIPAFQALIPKSFVHNWDRDKSILDLRLKNGSLIHFQTLEDPDQGRGQGLDWLWIDEICELTKMHWEVIRPSLAGDTVAFFTTTPRSFDWVYEEFYRPFEQSVPGYLAWKAKTADSANPRITKEYLERERATMTEKMFRQEYEADFVSFQGAIYDEDFYHQVLQTDDAVKAFIPEWPDIAPWRQVMIGIDTGADHPFGAVKMVSTAKGVVVVGEYLRRHSSYLEHSSAILSLAANPNARYALNKNERQGIIELTRHGLTNLTEAPNDNLAGIQRVQSLLKQKQLWFALPSCPKTVQQMMAYRWAENTNPKDGQARRERVYKVNDDLPDCVRYACMAFPLLVQNAPVKSKERDISNLPLKAQQDIEAMRRIRKAEEASAGPDSTFQDHVEDFWGSEGEDSRIKGPEPKLDNFYS